MRSYRSAMRENSRRTYRLLSDGVENACLSFTGREGFRSALHLAVNQRDTRCRAELCFGGPDAPACTDGYEPGSQYLEDSGVFTELATTIVPFIIASCSEQT